MLPLALGPPVRYIAPPSGSTVTWEAQPENYYADPDPAFIVWSIAALLLIFAGLWIIYRRTVGPRAEALLDRCRPAVALLLRISGTCAVVLSFFAILELFMACAMHRMYDYAFAPDPILQWKMRPGFAGVYPPIGAAPMAINSLGYRGAECAREKAPGAVRIFILGDSFSFGLKVRNDEIYAHFLPGELAKGDRSLKVEVINGAVPGYCSLQALTRLRREAWRLSPDIVILGFLVNDTMKSFAPERELVPTSPLVITLKDALYRSRTFIALKKLAVQMRRGGGPHKAQGYLSIDRVSPGEYRENLERFAAELEAHRVKGLFLDVPNIETTVVQERYRAIFLDVARAKGVPALDLYHLWHREIPPAKLDTLFVIDPGGGNRHPTPEGHALIARALAGFLLEHRGYYFP